MYLVHIYAFSHDHDMESYQAEESLIIKDNAS